MDRALASYYLQKGDAGISESIAEVFAQTYGTGSDLVEDVLKWFPALAQVMKRTFP